MNYVIEGNNIYLKKDKKVVASISFDKTDGDTYNINHTYVEESLRGQGIASELVKMAVEEIERRGAHVTATCTYAKKWLERKSHE